MYSLRIQYTIQYMFSQSHTHMHVISDNSWQAQWTDYTCGGFIKGILRWVRCTKSLRVLFLHRRPPSWTTLVLFSRAVFIFNELAYGVGIVGGGMMVTSELWRNKQTNSRVLNDIGRNSLLGNRKKIAKFLMRTFACSTFLYEWTEWHDVDITAEITAELGL